MSEAQLSSRGVTTRVHWDGVAFVGPTHHLEVFCSSIVVGSVPEGPLPWFFLFSLHLI